MVPLLLKILSAFRERLESPKSGIDAKKQEEEHRGITFFSSRLQLSFSIKINIARPRQKNQRIRTHLSSVMILLKENQSRHAPPRYLYGRQSNPRFSHMFYKYYTCIARMKREKRKKPSWTPGVGDRWANRIPDILSEKFWLESLPNIQYRYTYRKTYSYVYGFEVLEEQSHAKYQNKID